MYAFNLTWGRVLWWRFLLRYQSALRVLEARLLAFWCQVRLSQTCIPRSFWWDEMLTVSFFIVKGDFFLKQRILHLFLLTCAVYFSFSRHLCFKFFVLEKTLLNCSLVVALQSSNYSDLYYLKVSSWTKFEAQAPWKAKLNSAGWQIHIA